MVEETEAQGGSVICQKPARELVAELLETLSTLSIKDTNLLQPLIPSLTYEKYTSFISASMLDFTSLSRYGGSHYYYLGWLCLLLYCLRRLGENWANC